MEGSCSAPLAIALTQMGDGLIGHATASTGLNDVPQVSEGQCIGGMAGGGTDRIYKIDLMGLSDLEVRVGAQFDAVVRVMTSPCMLKDQLPGACADQVGVAAEERVLVPGVAAGTYYIVVDGKSAGQSGNFSVDVAARCPLENVRIDRVVLESPFRTHIVNTNPKCGVDMSRIGIFSQPEATDTPGTLPAQTLAPFGRRILTTQTPPPMMQLYQGNIPYDTTNYAGAFYLCRGPCDKLNGLNVYDAIRWKGTSGSLPGTLPLPRAVMFDAEKAALTDRLTTSYYRVLTEGVAPNFKATDFEAAYFVETFEDQQLDGWLAAAPAYMTAYETGKVGNSALALSGANPSMTVWDGPRYPMVDNAGTLMTAVQPTSVSLWASATETTKNAGYVFFGHAGMEGGSFGSLFRGNATLGFGAPTITLVQPYAANTWYFIEYKNFNFTSNTVEALVDGVSKGTLTMTTGVMNLLSLRNIDASKVLIDQIIVK
jgi:hypothetical protein